MKPLFAFIFLLVYSGQLWAQEDDAIKMYDWEIAKNANPDSIFGISFAKLKLDELPIELYKFKKLRLLNLEKNKLRALPDFVADFKNLVELNVGKNKLETFPIQLCRMPSVERLILNRNYFESIPDCIVNLKDLKYLDLYDCPINKIPNTLAELKKLEEIDFSGIRFSPTFQKAWLEKLPDVKLDFDPPCDCME